MYKIYIQKFGNDFIGDYAYAAYEGFNIKREYPIFFFEDIDEVPKSRNNVVIGCIEDTEKYLIRIGITIPKPLNIPHELGGYAKRKFEIITMGEFKKQTNLPIFIKPHEKLKTFPSGVIKNQSSRKMFFNDIPDDFKVLTSEVVNIVSEYRGFVRRGKLVGLKHYIGDFRIFPDIRFIDEVISSYTTGPRAYTIDFGITDKNDTLLIECNDGWSVGSYGLDPDIYRGFLMDRWIELVNS